MNKKISLIVSDLVDEIDWAFRHYPKFNSDHEAYATILEELEEYWDEVKKKPANRNYEEMQKELIQLAAMSIRAIHDSEHMNV